MTSRADVEMMLSDDAGLLHERPGNVSFAVLVDNPTGINYVSELVVRARSGTAEWRHKCYLIVKLGKIFELAS